ncbi:MAG: DUF1697 domain-containing protein [Bacteroidales bacterium]
MSTYIAFLRGINVSGKNLIKMKDLENYISELKFSGVKTYIQSGNIVFKTKETDTLVLRNLIREKITEKTGFEIEVIIKNAEQIFEIIKANPFSNRADSVYENLYVTLTEKIPEKDLLARIADLKFENDEFVVVRDVIYLCCKKGYGKSKLSNTFFESKLKLKATTRNWKTMNALAGLTE